MSYRLLDSVSITATDKLKTFSGKISAFFFSFFSATKHQSARQIGSKNTNPKRFLNNNKKSLSNLKLFCILVDVFTNRFVVSTEGIVDKK